MNDRAELEHWARLVCETEGVTPPSIVWVAEPHARCGKRSIRVPDPAYVDEVDPYREWYRVPALLLHELAHWIAYKREGRICHSPRMYATLFRLSDLWALPTDVLRQWERAYCPRSSAAGWRLYERERPPVDWQVEQ